MIQRTYSKKLIQDWKKALIATFGFKEYMDLLIQPTIGPKHLTYLPLINYTDRTSDQIEDLLELTKESPHLIRTLNFEYREFKDYDPVTLRMDVKGLTIDEVKSKYKRLARRNINKEQHLQRYSVQRAEKYTDQTVDNFYAVLKDIYKRHGTPIIPKTLLTNFIKFLEDIDIFFMYDQEKPIGAIFVHYDNKIATFQYGGIISEIKEISNSYILYHSAIQYIVENKDVDIIDFGRSPYNIGTYFFKTRFGAYPVKIDLHTHQEQNIYSKYQLAANIWKKLPAPITDYLGPRLTKYLVEL